MSLLLIAFCIVCASPFVLRESYEIDDVASASDGGFYAAGGDYYTCELARWTASGALVWRKALRPSAYYGSCTLLEYQEAGSNNRSLVVILTLTAGPMVVLMDAGSGALKQSHLITVTDHFYTSLLHVHNDLLYLAGRGGARTALWTMMVDLRSMSVVGEARANLTNGWWLWPGAIVPIRGGNSMLVAATARALGAPNNAGDALLFAFNRTHTVWSVTIPSANGCWDAVSDGNDLVYALCGDVVGTYTYLFALDVSTSDATVVRAFNLYAGRGETLSWATGGNLLVAGAYFSMLVTPDGVLRWKTSYSALNPAGAARVAASRETSEFVVAVGYFSTPSAYLLHFDANGTFGAAADSCDAAMNVRRLGSYAPRSIGAALNVYNNAVDSPVVPAVVVADVSSVTAPSSVSGGYLCGDPTIASLLPSASPSPPPSLLPTRLPSSWPSPAPTTPLPSPLPPSPAPTSTAPTPALSARPSPSPSLLPTSAPTPPPTTYPTWWPSAYPSPFPTPPTNYPTYYPTFWPSPYPSAYPSPFPTPYTPQPTSFSWFTHFPTPRPTPYASFLPPTSHPTAAARPTFRPTPYPWVPPTASPRDTRRGDASSDDGAWRSFDTYLLVGGIVLCVLFVGLIYFCCCSARNRRQQSTALEMYGLPTTTTATTLTTRSGAQGATRPPVTAPADALLSMQRANLRGEHEHAMALYRAAPHDAQRAFRAWFRRLCAESSVVSAAKRAHNEQNHELVIELLRSATTQDKRRIRRWLRTQLEKEE